MQPRRTRTHEARERHPGEQLLGVRGSAPCSGRARRGRRSRKGVRALPTGRQYIRAVAPEGSSTSTVPRRPGTIASVACASNVDWSAGASEARAWSLIITTSLLSAITIPDLRLQVRRYSWKSSSWDALASASNAWRIWSAVVFARVSSSEPASLRQQVRSTAPTSRPVTGWWMGTPAHASILEVLGVVLVAEDVGRPAHLEGGPDSVGPHDLLGIAEARSEQDAVEVSLQLAVAGESAQHQSRLVGEDDADRLALELLAQASQHRLRAAAEPGVEVHVGLEPHLDLVGRHLHVQGPPPGREDRVPHASAAREPRRSGSGPGSPPRPSGQAEPASVRSASASPAPPSVWFRASQTTRVGRSRRPGSGAAPSR